LLAKNIRPLQKPAPHLGPPPHKKKTLSSRESYTAAELHAIGSKTHTICNRWTPSPSFPHS
jgi:hypothetical protein